MVLLRNPSTEVALEVGERIRDAVERIDLHDIGVGVVTVSVGASVSRSDGEAVAALVERADHALYRAKRQGRNRVVMGDLPPGNHQCPDTDATA